MGFKFQGSSIFGILCVIIEAVLSNNTHSIRTDLKTPRIKNLTFIFLLIIITLSCFEEYWFYKYKSPE